MPHALCDTVVIFSCFQHQLGCTILKKYVTVIIWTDIDCEMICDIRVNDHSFIIILIFIENH